MVLDRHTDQWNLLEDLEIDPHITHVQLFTKVPRQCNQELKMFLTNVRKTGQPI